MQNCLPEGTGDAGGPVSVRPGSDFVGLTHLGPSDTFTLDPVLMQHALQVITIPMREANEGEQAGHGAG